MRCTSPTGSTSKDSNDGAGISWRERLSGSNMHPVSLRTPTDLLWFTFVDGTNSESTELVTTETNGLSSMRQPTVVFSVQFPSPLMSRDTRVMFAISSCKSFTIQIHFSIVPRGLLVIDYRLLCRRVLNGLEFCQHVDIELSVDGVTRNRVRIERDSLLQRDNSNVRRLELPVDIVSSSVVCFSTQLSNGDAAKTQLTLGDIVTRSLESPWCKVVYNCSAPELAWPLAHAQSGPRAQSYASSSVQSADESIYYCGFNIRGLPSGIHALRGVCVSPFALVSSYTGIHRDPYPLNCVSRVTDGACDLTVPAVCIRGACEIVFTGYSARGSDVVAVGSVPTTWIHDHAAFEIPLTLDPKSVRATRLSETRISVSTVVNEPWRVGVLRVQGGKQIMIESSLALVVRISNLGLLKVVPSESVAFPWNRSMTQLEIWNIDGSNLIAETIISSDFEYPKVLNFSLGDASLQFTVGQSSMFPEPFLQLVKGHSTSSAVVPSICIDLHTLILDDCENIAGHDCVVCVHSVEQDFPPELAHMGNQLRISEWRIPLLSSPVIIGKSFRIHESMVANEKPTWIQLLASVRGHIYSVSCLISWLAVQHDGVLDLAMVDTHDGSRAMLQAQVTISKARSPTAPIQAASTTDAAHESRAAMVCVMGNENDRPVMPLADFDELIVSNRLPSDTQADKGNINDEFVLI